jgi:hypothetical protein
MSVVMMNSLFSKNIISLKSVTPKVSRMTAATELRETHSRTKDRPRPPHTTPLPLSHIGEALLTRFTSISLARSQLINGSIYPIVLPMTPSPILLQPHNAHNSSNPTDLLLSSRLCTPPLRRSPRSTKTCSGRGVSRVASWHPPPPSTPLAASYRLSGALWGRLRQSLGQIASKAPKGI